MNGKTEDRSCLIFERGSNIILFAEHDPETLEAKLYNATVKRLSDIDRMHSRDQGTCRYIVALCTPEVVEKQKESQKTGEVFKFKTDHTGLKICLA